MDYWILTADSNEGGVIDAYPRGSPAGYLFDKGRPLVSEYPPDAAVRFSKNFPQARKLEDFQPNTLGALIVSRRVRELLDGLGVKNAEYLPVAMKDHKDQVIAPDYAFLNPIGTEPAVDMKASDVEMDPLDEDEVIKFNKLVLDRKAISPDALIFRCRARPQLFMIRDEVKTGFEKAGLTGYRLFAADGWNGEDY